METTVVCETYSRTHNRLKIESTQSFPLSKADIRRYCEGMDKAWVSGPLAGSFGWTEAYSGPADYKEVWAAYQERYEAGDADRVHIVLAENDPLNQKDRFVHELTVALKGDANRAHRFADAAELLANESAAFSLMRYGGRYGDDTPEMYPYDRDATPEENEANERCRAALHSAIDLAKTAGQRTPTLENLWR